MCKSATVGSEKPLAAWRFAWRQPQSRRAALRTSASAREENDDCSTRLDAQLTDDRHSLVCVFYSLDPLFCC